MTRLNFKLVILLLLFSGTHAQRTVKPVLHGRHWMAITGKPLGATAGATIFSQGGNAVDAACAMLAATATMFDVLSWGGETQALIYNPKTKKVIGVNALGVAPTGATPEFYKQKDLKYPPQFGPLSAVTPGTPGGLMVMLAEYGSMSLAQVLKPCMEMAEGYPIEAQAANSIERHKKRIKEWPYSKNVFLVHHGEKREAPSAGEVFKQLDLLATLQKLVDAEAKALKKGKSRKNAIYDAYDRFYKGDIAKEFVRSTQEQGGLITMNDLANWQVYLEEPVTTNYKGIDVYKLTTWVQGPVMLQALNMIELFDLKAMGYNSSRYIHTLYQAMNHAFADRDFYYGDPYFPPEEPVKGLLSKEYAAARVKQMNLVKNDPDVKPGDPYKFMAGKNPYLDLLDTWGEEEEEEEETSDALYGFDDLEKEFFTGTTSIQTTDTDGWVVSITPSGGWIPTVIAGKTGIGLSQRGQSFVLSEEENPYNVIAPGKRPRATLTPAMALKNGKPYLSFAVQGGDTQDQNLLQFFLNIVEFDMNIQEASEAANINSYQMYSSFGDHNKETGRLIVQEQTPPWVMKELKEMGYKVQKRAITSGPINAIYFDWEHGSFWGGSSHHGEDYGIAW
ncbi:MAG TPA: gamma-glutamyltransferase family protein [Candidatus Marinimicrobia bacterium]|nr:gamma-glutamyltransferase family protein [Candidatus Neomarinimicrobiota bacterium]HIO89294.1 gamma-glutamyltransferase family protein [Candidatus Neomarinimicrobiota bacterium]